MAGRGLHDRGGSVATPGDPRPRASTRSGVRARGLVVALVLGAAVGVGGTAPATPAGAQAAPATAGVEPAPEAAAAAVPGGDAPRPRILFASEQLADLQERLEREPYRRLFVALHDRTAVYDASAPLGDPAIVAQRNLARAAKNLAFEVALDRTVVDGRVVPFPDAAARTAAGDRVRDLLLHLYPRSRLAVAPPLGGYDRDINTSEEIVDYATAYDTLLGAGYDLGADGPIVADRLAGLVGELYANYVHPETAGNAALLMQNNHRSKVGAALAIAAVALAGWTPPPGVAGPAEWFDHGALQVDDVLRFMLVTGDGAYGEGPYYYRYTAMNLLPYARLWERHIGAGSYTATDTDGTRVEIPSPTRHPLYERTQRWMLDTTVPDGGMAPIDDGNPNRSYYFGLVPPWLPDAPAAYWRWQDAPQPYDTDGAVDLGADAIVTYDDAVTPQPPWWSGTQFYVEGGTATFRSGWDDQAVMALGLGEHDTASEFAHDRRGAPRGPQSHEHPDPGAFLLHAFGERLALDPGYLTFGTHGLVNKPQDHNTVLVDGQGPADYLLPTLWWGSTPDERPPTEGQSTITATVDGAGLDAATVVSDYRGAALERRFVFPDERYLVVADHLSDTDPTDGTAHAYTWMLHGNGGGTSGGTFEPTAVGGRWTVGGARLDSAVAVAGTTPALSTSEPVHEGTYQQQLTHTALATTAEAPTGAADAVQVVYPSRAGQAPPTASTVGVPGAAAVTVDDPAGDRWVTVARVADPDPGGAVAPGGTAPPGIALPGAGVGAPPSLVTDGRLAVADRHADGRLRLAWADGATTLTTAEGVGLGAPGPRTLGVRLGDGTADLVAAPDDRSNGLSVARTPTTATVTGLPFTPTAVDGACDLDVTAPGSADVTLTRDGRATLRAGGENGRPAADAGPDRRVGVGSAVHLDGGASCDPDEDELAPAWTLVSAPAGSAWSLVGGDTWRPTLAADRVGPYRVRLTVTDPAGAVSDEAEVTIVAGPQDGDGVDDDLDGRIDTDDADLDGPSDALLLAVDGGSGPALAGGLVPGDAFAVERDAAGAATRVAGRATLAGGEVVAFDATRRRDGTGWRGWVQATGDLVGPPVDAGLGRASLDEIAPGVVAGKITAGRRTVQWLVVDAP